MKSKVGSEGTIALERSRFADYITLTKPELTSLSVVTALAGFYLATFRGFDVVLFSHTFLGTALIGAGAGALNQYMERDFDRKMKRTERRPLPSGRLSPAEVLVFGVSLAVVGILELFSFVNPLSGFLGCATISTYLFLYTPLKRITPFATVIGGIPGALPPMIGWAAVRNEISIEAWILFAILFFWQIPHFLSLAWMYRKDYARAGYPMLTVVDESGASTSRQILIYSLALLPATALLSVVGLTGTVFMFGALLLGAAFLLNGILLAIAKSNVWARREFFASLLYLPMVLGLMVLDKL